MNNMALIMAAVGGGLGGAIGALIARRFASGSPTAQRVIILLPVLVLADVGVQLAKSDWFNDHVHPPTRVELAMRPHLKELENDPVLRAKISADPARAEEVGRELGHLGLKRLPAAQLDRWNDLRLLLAKESKPLCAGFWTGKFDGAVVNHAIEGLPDPALRGWYDLSFESMRLEGHDAPFPAVKPDAVTAGLTAIAQKLNDTDRARFTKAISGGADLNEDDACWTMTTLMTTVKTLDLATREGLLRGLAAI